MLIAQDLSLAKPLTRHLASSVWQKCIDLSPFFDSKSSSSCLYVDDIRLVKGKVCTEYSFALSRKFLQALICFRLVMLLTPLKILPHHEWFLTYSCWSNVHLHAFFLWAFSKIVIHTGPISVT